MVRCGVPGSCLPAHPEAWDSEVPAYFKKNFDNSAGTDWHPVVAGVVISNEQVFKGLDDINVISLAAGTCPAGICSINSSRIPGQPPARTG